MRSRQYFREFLLIIFILCIEPRLGFFEDDDDYSYNDPDSDRCPGIRNKIKNGRVRYMHNGRIVKFVCKRRFDLVGHRTSTCVRGEWSNPVPICVASGCNPVRTLSNGRITETYSGALLIFDCNDGYVLRGKPSIYCDGRRWNKSPPLCVKTLSTTENKDETAQDDYTTANSFTTQSTSYTSVENSEEYTDRTKLLTENLDLINGTSFVSSTTLTTNLTFAKTDPFRLNRSPITSKIHFEDYSTETVINGETIISTDAMSSVLLKTEKYTASSSMKTSMNVFTTSPVAIASSSLKTSTNFPVTTNSTEKKTTVTSTTPSVTFTSFQTNVPTTKQITQTTTQTTATSLSTLSKSLDSTSQNFTIPLFNKISTKSLNNFSSTEPYAFTSSAAPKSNIETITPSTVTFISTRNTYSLRPRNRTDSTIKHATTSTTSIKNDLLTTNTHLKENIPDSTVTTLSLRESSSRYSDILPKKQSKESFMKSLKTNRLLDTSTRVTTMSQTTTTNLPLTAKFSNLFTKSTRSTLPKNSDFYESKDASTSSKSSVPVVLTVAIIILICIIIVATYIFKKQRKKRSSKVSDDSEIRFLAESDYMEYA